MTTAKAKLAASGRRQQRACDEIAVMSALADALYSEHRRYAESSDFWAGLVLFKAALKAAEIERSLVRLRRRWPWIEKHHDSVRALPAVLEVGRRLIAEHNESQALKSGSAES
jgi:hypothetical protein